MRNFINSIRMLLTPGDKLRLLFVIFMMGIGALMEMLGVGVLVSSIALFLKPGLMAQNRVLIFLYDFGGFASRNEFIVVGVICVGIFLVLKNLFSLFIVYLQSSLVFSKLNDLSTRLFRNYIEADYSFALNHSSAEMNNNIARVFQLCYCVLLPLMQLTADLLVVILLLAAAAFTLPLVTIGSIVFMVAAGGVTYASMRRVNYLLGRSSIAADNTAAVIRTDSLRGLKYIKTAMKENFFTGLYHQFYGRYTRCQIKLYTIGQVPRLTLETAAFILVLVIFVVMVKMQIPEDQILLSFTLLLAVLSRVLPSCSRIHYSLSQIRQNEAAIDRLLPDFTRLAPENLCRTGKDVTLERELELRNLSFAYSGGRTLFDNFRCRLGVNHTLGVIGKTGCGKTTLVDLVLGLLKPVSGAVLADGTDIGDNLAAWRRLVAYVPQNIYLFDDTIRANVAFGEEKIDDARVMEALRMAQIDDFVRSLPDGLEHRLIDGGSNISGGQRQRIGIARALYRNPRLLILDEATSALDTATESAIVSALDRLHGKLTMIVIAHRLSTLEHCDQIINLEELTQ